MKKVKDDSAGYTPIRTDDCHTLRSSSFNVVGMFPPAIRPIEPMSYRYNFRMSSEEIKLFCSDQGFPWFPLL